MSLKTIRAAMRETILANIKLVKSVQGHYGAFDVDFIEREVRKASAKDIPAVYIVATGTSDDRIISGNDDQSFVQWGAFVVARDRRDTDDVLRGDTANAIAFGLATLIKNEDWQGLAQECGDNVRATNLNSVAIIDDAFQAFLVTWEQWFSDSDLQLTDEEAVVLGEYLVQNTEFVVHDETPPDGTPTQESTFDVRENVPEDP